VLRFWGVMIVGCPTSPPRISRDSALVNGMAGSGGINSGISNALDWGWDGMEEVLRSEGGGGARNGIF